MLSHGKTLRALGIGLVVVLIVMLSSAVYINFIKPPFLKAVVSIAGENALDCGISSLQESKSITNKCVEAAFSSQRSFYAIYYLQGVDSFPVKAFAYDGDKLYALGFEIQPWGKRASLIEITNYTKKKCADPRPRELMGRLRDQTHPFVCYES